MVNSVLHAIKIQELSNSNPDFYQEYCNLVDGISNQIRELAKNQADHLDYSSFTENYDGASSEPVLQVIIGAHKTELYIHIYIHKDNYFVVGKSGSGTIARKAEEAVELVAQKIKTIKE
jgi:hypothetical protein